MSSPRGMLAADAPAPEQDGAAADLDQILERLRWSPKQRLDYLVDMLDFEARARQAARRLAPLPRFQPERMLQILEAQQVKYVLIAARQPRTDAGEPPSNPTHSNSQLSVLGSLFSIARRTPVAPWREKTPIPAAPTLTVLMNPAAAFVFEPQQRYASPS